MSLQAVIEETKRRLDSAASSVVAQSERMRTLNHKTYTEAMLEDEILLQASRGEAFYSEALAYLEEHLRAVTPPPPVA